MLLTNLPPQFLRFSVNSAIFTLYVPGVVVGDPALCFAETMQYVFLPQLRQQKDWGRCPPEIATQTIHNLEKYTQQMYDTIAMSGNTHLSTNQQVC